MGELSLILPSSNPTLLTFPSRGTTRTLIRNRLLLDSLNVMRCQLFSWNTLQIPSSLLRDTLSSGSNPILICHTDDGDDKQFFLHTFEEQHSTHQETIKSVVRNSFERAAMIRRYSDSHSESKDSEGLTANSIIGGIADKFDDKVNELKQDAKEEWQDVKSDLKTINDLGSKFHGKVEDILGFEEREFPYESIDLIGATASGLAAWSYQFVAHHWGKLHPFRTYNISNINDVNTGIYSLETGQQLSIQQSQLLGQKLISRTYTSDDAIRYSIAADWGAGTREALTVAKLMNESNPHWTLHAGDVYYVSSEDEVKQNVLGIAPKNCVRGVRFPHGSLGSFFIMG